MKEEHKEELESIVASCKGLAHLNDDECYRLGKQVSDFFAALDDDDCLEVIRITNSILYQS